MRKFLSKLNFRIKIELELKKISKWIKFPQVSMTPGVWAVTMVRNEETTLPLIIEHFKNQGISKVLVVNHLSTDDTLARIKHFGSFVQVAEYTNAAYEQRAVMTLASRFAAKSGASWIIPFDADEIWWPNKDVTIAKLLDNTNCDRIPAPHYDFLPPENSSNNFTPQDFTLRRTSPNPMPKTAFRAHPKAIVLMGNHWVHRPGTSGDGLVIAHYPYRSKEQFHNKVKVGAAAINALTESKGLGTHWQQWNKMNKDEFDSFWNSLKQSKDIINDPELRQLRLPKK
jgi:glycosyltransferase involved in cell wall biosynthesis